LDTVLAVPQEAWLGNNDAIICKASSADAEIATKHKKG